MSVRHLRPVAHQHRARDDEKKAATLPPAVVAAQQKIADTFTTLKLIPKSLSIKDVIWTPPAKVAQQ